MRTTAKGWGIAFVPPELLDICWDYVRKKGDETKIHKPERLVVVALQDYLSRHGYQAQVEEVEQDYRKATGRTEPMPSTLDRLDSKQRKTVLILMENRNLSQEKAIEWVNKHPDEVGRIWS